MDGKGQEGKKKKWYILDGRSVSLLLVLLLAICFYVGLNHVQQLKIGLEMFIKVVRPFIVGFAIAYLLNVPVGFFEDRFYKDCRGHRGFSILTVYLIALAVIGILITLVGPQVYQSAMDLANNLEFYLSSLSELIQSQLGGIEINGEGVTDAIGSYQDWMKNLSDTVSEVLPHLFNSVVALGSGVISAITAVISSIYMLAGKDRLVCQLKKILYAIFPKPRSDFFLSVCSKANCIFVGFINGKLLDSAIIGAMCFGLCLLLHIPYAVLVAVIVGITNVVPFFGPIIGAIPCTLILVLVDPWAALRFFILVIFLQQFDGNILGPKILGDSTGLSAIWVLIAIVVGGGLFGFPGMVLGVPTFAVLYELVRDWVHSRLREKHIDGDGNPLPADDQSDPS